MHTRSELEHLVSHAFAKEPFRGNISLRQGRLLDDWVDSQERYEEARNKDETGDWEGIPDADIAHFGSAFTFLDNEAVPFYLPALMCYCIRHWDRPDHILATLLFHFDSGLDRFSCLSEQQRSVVTAFLEFVVDYSRSEFDVRAAKAALKKHWAQFKDWTI